MSPTLMPETMNLNVRISGSLKDYVSEEIDSGSFENASEFVRSLIRQEKARSEEQAFEAMKAELQLAFAAPESEYEPLSAAEVIARNANKS